MPNNTTLGVTPFMMRVILVALQHEGFLEGMDAQTFVSRFMPALEHEINLMTHIDGVEEESEMSDSSTDDEFEYRAVYPAIDLTVYDEE